ncbi:type II toxin-antitoxin system Phd/YefM family antitoxin [Thauera sp. 2A1]|uniref:type II toxin-antitoxin system Phd/YefM family antitoxin n=1 Tax=Thauera sp. 2A1 TaxID=2570191 RepID=UPI001290BF35|nr:type II toxin-antitoxin system prevent-host-death family antitoxin [Thauera sp. 2A1]KAI5916286.1 type II toxin-antitoxin system prevent-host-death family antitoxin [Thauera sp. 2A1]
MQAMSVADAKAHLSELLSQVESGDEVVITRRGRPIARLVPERAAAIAGAPFDFEALKQFVDSQPDSTQDTVRAMRESDAW